MARHPSKSGNEDRRLRRAVNASRVNGISDPKLGRGAGGHHQNGREPVVLTMRNGRRTESSVCRELCAQRPRTHCPAIVLKEEPVFATAEAYEAIAVWP